MFCATRPCRLLLLFLLSAILGITAQAQGTQGQTIQFLPIADRPVTSAPFQVVAIASSDLPVTLAVKGPATFDSRRLLTLTGPGAVTVTATQPGNTQYAAAPAKTLSFNVTKAAGTIAWSPKSIVYGSPLSAAGLNATATATPLANPSQDTVTMSNQIGSSQIKPSGPITYPQTSSVFRYEGSTMAASTGVNDNKGYVPTGSMPPLGINYRVAFTCNCSEFEFVVQARGSYIWLWVDGAFQGLDMTQEASSYPNENYILYKFPSKRVRQIKVEVSGAAPFYGGVTGGSDTISTPQVPVGSRVIVFGDSWTGPTIVQPATGASQDGGSGAGYAEFLGEYFNWDYWVSGVGGEGFSNAGTDANGHSFPQRVLTDVCPFSPAAVVIMGGVNDGSASETTEQSNITTTLANLKKCLPGVPVYLYGPQFTTSGIDTAFAAAAKAYSNVHYTDMGNQNWLYGSTTASSTGNEYLYFNGHPTPLGHNYLAEKIAIDLIAAYPSLQPGAYPLMTPTAVAGSFSYSSGSTAMLPAGSTKITAEFTPNDTVNYADASLTATVVVTKASTTASLAQKTTNGVPAVTVTVKPQIAGTPSGSVVVSEGSTKLATLTLSSGTATYTGTGLANGTHNLTLSYGGDTNFNASSASISVTVNHVAVDFSLSATPTLLTLAPGTSGNVSLTITPSGELDSTLSLTCPGLPVETSCTFSDGTSSVAVGDSVLTATIVIQTTKPQNSALAPLGTPAAPGGYGVTALCGVIGLGVLGVGGRGRKARRQVFLFAGAALLGVATIGLSGCGTPAGSYPLQLTLTDSASTSLTHSVLITLTVT